MSENLSTDLPDLEESHYCEVHPDRETELRCNKCGRYMCAQCAVSTPIGYRCRECVRQVDNKFFNIGQMDYVTVFAVTAGVGLVGGAISSYVHFWPLLLFAGVAVGGGVAQVVRQVIQGRRGRYTGEVAAGGLVLGGVIGGLVISWLRYPSDYAAFWDQVGSNVDRVPPQMRQAVPMLSDYIVDNTFSLSMIVFLGIAAIMVYSRMKN